jgi:hypothetical protein
MSAEDTLYSGSSLKDSPLLDFTNVITRKELSQKNIKKKRWSKEELFLLSQYIREGISLQDVSKLLNRSVSAIYSKANKLGYGYKTNKSDGLKYFKEEIQHKNRRTKEEILEGKEFLSVATENNESQGTDNKVDTVIIPKKIEINLIELNRAIQILTTARNNAILIRTSANTVGVSNET